MLVARWRKPRDPCWRRRQVSEAPLRALARHRLEATAVAEKSKRLGIAAISRYAGDHDQGFPSPRSRHQLSDVPDTRCAAPLPRAMTHRLRRQRFLLHV